MFLNNCDLITLLHLKKYLIFLSIFKIFLDRRFQAPALKSQKSASQFVVTNKSMTHRYNSELSVEMLQPCRRFAPFRLRNDNRLIGLHFEMRRHDLHAEFVEGVLNLPVQF